MSQRVLRAAAQTFHQHADGPVDQHPRVRAVSGGVQHRLDPVEHFGQPCETRGEGLLAGGGALLVTGHRSRTSRMVAISCCAATGLVTYASDPAARLLSRSPGMAFAVTAMTGSVAYCGMARIAAVAW